MVGCTANDPRRRFGPQHQLATGAPAALHPPCIAAPLLPSTQNRGYGRGWWRAVSRVVAGVGREVVPTAPASGQRTRTRTRPCTRTRCLLRSDVVAGVRWEVVPTVPASRHRAGALIPMVARLVVAGVERKVVPTRPASGGTVPRGWRAWPAGVGTRRRDGSGRHARIGLAP